MATADTFCTRLASAVAVAAEPSPETEPYSSHYRSRDQLQALLKTPLSPLEAALVHAKLGASHLHVEEPHNAQPALENAARFLAPELLEFAAQLSDDDAEPSDPQRSEGDVDTLLAELPRVQIAAEHDAFAINVLELLNQLGILWANRTQPRRALCFFQACEVYCAARYEHLALEEEQEEEQEDLLTALRDVRAHANFYLAQVYGSLNMPGASAQYCLATLELQLRMLLVPAGDDDDESDPESVEERLEAVQDWAKNALRLVDYYLAADNLADAAICLRACDRLLFGAAARGADDSDATESVRVQRAETALNWAKLHHAALKIAQYRDEGYVSPPAAPPHVSAIAARMETTLAAADANTPAEASEPSEPAMQFVSPDAISSFDAARGVFKMGMRACDRAKLVFVLDGFVTQHVRVLQLESSLYKRLVHFEADRKRQVAMHLRRLAILSPVAGEQLNPAAYCALLQEVNYECAEVAAEVFDLKHEKRGGEVDDKANAYALKAVNWYQQYVLLFYSQDGGQGQQQYVKTGTAVQLPSSAMSANEFRSVLLGYFGLARVCGRVQFARQDKEKTVLFWKQSLAYHHAVLELTRKFEVAQAGRRGEADEAAALHQLFDAELKISQEMVELLPEKINQLVYNDKLL